MTTEAVFAHADLAYLFRDVPLAADGYVDTWSSTHATCYHHGVSGNWKNGWRTRRIIHSDEHRAGSKPGTLAYEWHTWAVEYDGETVKYFVDDKPITAYHYHASPTDSKEIERTPAAPLTKLADASLIKKTFDEGWRFIINDYVEADADQKPISPSDSFPKQTMLIDYVRVFQKGDYEIGRASCRERV